MYSLNSNSISKLKRNYPIKVFKMYILIFWIDKLVNIYWLFKEFSSVTSSNSPQKESKKEVKLTRLTLILCLVYLIGNSIDCFLLINDIFAAAQFGENGYLTIACNVLLYFSHSANLFVYLRFNQQFRLAVISIFKCRN